MSDTGSPEPLVFTFYLICVTFIEEIVYGFYQKLCVCVGNELYIMLTFDMGYSYGGRISSLYIGAQFYIQKYGSSPIGG